MAANSIRTILILLFLIQPKINRVLDGKEVIVSNLLRERRPSEPSDHNAHSSNYDPMVFRTDGLSPPTIPPRMTLQRDDPLPRQLEICMYDMLGILRTVTKRSGEGRALRTSDWNALRNETSKLSNWTHRIELAWHADEEPVTQRNLPNYPMDDNQEDEEKEGVTKGDEPSENVETGTPPVNEKDELTSSPSNDELGTKSDNEIYADGRDEVDALHTDKTESDNRC